MFRLRHGQIIMASVVMISVYVSWAAVIDVILFVIVRATSGRREGVMDKLTAPGLTR